MGNYSTKHCLIRSSTLRSMAWYIEHCRNLFTLLRALRDLCGKSSSERENCAGRGWGFVPALFRVLGFG